MADYLFAPDSVMWRVNRERVLLLGGPAAAILQVAHPAIAAGVAAHSDFRRGALGRLTRTLEAVYGIAFGTRAEAGAIAARVSEIHQRVKGSAPAYSAFDPDLQMWVLATLIAGAVAQYERFIAPLTEDEKDVFVRQMREFGEWFGLPRTGGPQDWNAFRDYYDGMIAGDLLGSQGICRELAQDIARPARPWWLRCAMVPARFLIIETLPSPVRERLGFRSTRSTRAAMRLFCAAMRRAVSLFPARLRFARQYRAA